MPTRREIWQHNSYFGHAAMARIHMVAIQSSHTTTHETKQIAAQIEKLSSDLADSLKTRTDQLKGKPDDQRS